MESESRERLPSQTKRAKTWSIQGCVSVNENGNYNYYAVAQLFSTAVTYMSLQLALAARAAT